MAGSKRKSREREVHGEPCPAETPGGGFPIVGVGASAGGLAAFEAFFSGMPADADPGMAFVLVQHLAPDHKSVLTELIRRYTRMEVFEVEDGMVVKPNCAYIIPPNRDMAFLNGTLQLMEPSAPRGRRLSIDFFFRSLAQDLHERAICVVLSGTGSDGTQGLRAVKSEGGMAMAQDPSTTEYDGMPRSAIATGLVDFQLPPAQMAAQLMAYAAHPYGRGRRVGGAPAPRAESALRKIFVLLRSQTGHDFSLYKPSTVNRRIERRMAVQGVDGMDAYVRFLQGTPAEIDALFRDLLINVTSFFRDPDAFKVVEERVLPGLFAGKPAGSPVRVWCPGCASGEEAYSLAILLQELQERLRQGFKVQVFATDIDGEAIAAARAGVYAAGIAADLSPERLARFFVAEADGASYRINRATRDMLVFSEQDVIKDPPFSRLDLISCRNLMIYMGPELQRRLIPLFHYALNPGGYLFLGTSETVGDFGELFTVLDRKEKLYQRREDPRGRHPAAFGRFVPPLAGLDSVTPRAMPRPMVQVKTRLRELAEQALLRQVVPAGALVNGHGDILYLHGRTGMYLEPPAGEAGVNNILRMAREGLRGELTASLHRAVTTRTRVRCPGLRVKTNGDFTTVDLVVVPVEGDAPDTTEQTFYLVILEEAIQSCSRADQGAAEGRGEPSEAEARVESLAQELRAKEDYLHSANEELETANEELKSSNEELQSVNEELQSTNEELETSKEELQSVNEELATVNAELQTKVTDLSRANNDMNNLLAGTGIATVFVDQRLRILRFTPTATRLINLIPSDVGRPVGHIVSNLTGYDSLVEDAQAVLDTLMPRQVDVRTVTGAWYSLKMLPYRTLDNVIEGVVMTFTDVSDVRKVHEALRVNEERLRVALRTAGVTVFTQDHDLRYTWVGEPSPILSADRVVGRTDADLLPAGEAAALTALKRRVLVEGVGLSESLTVTVDGVSRIVTLSLEPLRDDGGAVVGVTGCMGARPE